MGRGARGARRGRPGERYDGIGDAEFMDDVGGAALRAVA